jgi:hypothetical protein
MAAPASLRLFSAKNPAKVIDQTRLVDFLTASPGFFPSISARSKPQPSARITILRPLFLTNQ